MKSQLLQKLRKVLDALKSTLGDPGDLDNLLQHVAHTAHQFFNADTCIILAINPITNQLKASNVAGNPIQVDANAFKQSQNENMDQQLLREGFIAVEDLETTLEYFKEMKQAGDFCSLVILPLSMKYRQKLLGVLYLCFKQQQKFSADEYDLFQFFATEASFLLQKTWLLRRYQEVARIGHEINEELGTVDDLFKKLQLHAAGILDISNMFSLAIYQSQTNTLDIYAQVRGTVTYQSDIPLHGVYQHVRETRQTLFIRQIDAETEKLLPQISSALKAEGKETAIFVPLRVRDVILGILSVQHPEPNAYDQEDLLILELLATHVALARHNMRLYERLSRLNEMGQFLAQQLDSKYTLQTTVDKIREATKADVVILYPYSQALQKFVIAPQISGTLLALTPDSLSPNQPDGVPMMMMRREQALFIRQSNTRHALSHAPLDTRPWNFTLREKIRSTAVIPLRVKREPVGILFINFRHAQRFDAAQKLFIEGLSHHAANAVKNAQLLRTLAERRERELEILQSIDRELNRTLDLETVLNTILKLAHEHVPSEEASILLYNPRTNVLEIPAAIGSHASERQRHIIALEQTRGITRWVMEYKKPVRVDNVHRDQQWQAYYVEVSPEIKSELDVPLLDDEEVIGVLNFESTREGAFSQEDENFLLTLAGQAVIAIKNAQAYEREIRFVLWYQTELELEKITDVAQLEQAYKIVLDIAKEYSPSQVAIRRFDEESQELVLAQTSQPGSLLYPRLHLSMSLNGQVAQERRTIVVADTSNPPSGVVPAQLPDSTIHSLLITPILLKNQYYGNLVLMHQNIGHFQGDDIIFYEGLAKQLATALYRLETERNISEFEKQAIDLEIMSSIGQVSFELVHRWGNDLGLVPAYVKDIRAELEAQELHNPAISKKLDGILRVTRRVLDLSKDLKQSLTIPKEREIVPPRILLEEARMNALQSLSPAIQIDLAIDAAVADIKVYYALVADILRNLVTNAIEAMPATGGKITLKAHNAGRFVALEVEDTGSGIRPQQISKIFELSFSTKGSSGFGLWSARTNALKNHGDLMVKSELGKGTTFTLFLPGVEKATL